MAAAVRGVSNQWKLVHWLTGANRLVGKADLLVDAAEREPRSGKTRNFHPFLDGSWTPPGAREPAAPAGVGNPPRVWFKQAFPVQVLCDWRLVPSGVKFARVVGRGKPSDVPASYTELAVQLRASALVAFTALPRPPLPPQAVAGRSPAEMEARRVISMAARPPLPRLLEQSLDQLKQLAGQRFLSKSGAKSEIIRRLFASRWPKLRVMLDERPESAVTAQAVALECRSIELTSAPPFRRLLSRGVSPGHAATVQRGGSAAPAPRAHAVQQRGGPSVACCLPRAGAAPCQPTRCAI